MLELVIRVVVSLAVVLGLFWVFARTSAKRLGGRDRGMMRVRSRQALSRGASLAVVEVGSRTLVVGVSDSGGVRLLTELEPDATEPVPEPETVPAPRAVTQPEEGTQPVRPVPQPSYAEAGPAAFYDRSMPMPTAAPGNAVVPAGSPFAGRSVAELAMERLAAFAAAEQTHTPAPGTAFAPARFPNVAASASRTDMPGAPTPVTGASGLVGFVGAPGALPVAEPDSRSRLSVVPSVPEPVAHVDSVVARVLAEAPAPVAAQIASRPQDDGPLAGSLLSAATWRQAWSAATKRFPQPVTQPVDQPVEHIAADGDVA